jgi:hypothetical protein
MPGKRGAYLVFVRLGLMLAPIAIGFLLWAFYWQRSLVISSSRPAAATLSATPAEKRPVGPRIAVTAAPDVIVLSRFPLSSVPAISDSVDPDPVASFRELIRPHPGTSRRTAPVDPRMLRKIVDRGVVTFASSKTDVERAKGAHLIQVAALVGFPPARVLLVRNYPASESVRAEVPVSDVIRYASDFFKRGATWNDESNNVFLALAKYFEQRDEMALFAKQLLWSLRGDSQPELSHRIDLLFELLSRVRGSCAALTRLVATAGDSADQECSEGLATGVRRYIETTTPTAEEDEARRRGLLLLSELDVR